MSACLQKELCFDPVEQILKIVGPEALVIRTQLNIEPHRCKSLDKFSDVLGFRVKPISARVSSQLTNFVDVRSKYGGQAFDLIEARLSGFIRKQLIIGLFEHAHI